MMTITDWFTSKKALAGVAWELDVWGKLRAQRGAAKRATRRLTSITPMAFSR